MMREQSLWKSNLVSEWLKRANLAKERQEEVGKNPQHVRPAATGEPLWLRPCSPHRNGWPGSSPKDLVSQKAEAHGRSPFIFFFKQH